MSQQQEIEDFALDQFTFLITEYNFQKPLIKRDDWMTTISYLTEKIGIEIELDWRDLDVFILVVRLESGHLPKGYYVSAGKVCRIHLLQVLQKQGWGDAKSATQDVPHNKTQKRQRFSSEMIKSKIENYRHLLSQTVDLIIANSEAIFKT